jgi:delta24-sterol reductase
MLKGVKEYYHRHSKSIFWELQYLQPLGNSFLFRNTLGWANPPDISVIKKYQPEWILKLFSNNHVVQDYLVPLDQLSNFTSICDNELNVYPIWICPYKIIKHDYPGIMSLEKSELYVDVGYYGLSNNDSFNMAKSIAEIENLVIDIKGFIMLYAYNKLTDNKLKQMFNFDLYRKQRDKLNANDRFPEIYDKVCN